MGWQPMSLPKTGETFFDENQKVLAEFSRYGYHLEKYWDVHILGVHYINKYSVAMHYTEVRAAIDLEIKKRLERRARRKRPVIKRKVIRRAVKVK